MMKRAACGTVAAFCLAALLFSVRPAAGQDKAAAPLTSPPSAMLDAPIDAVVTSGDAFMLGPIQMVAPARTRSVFLNPQGRYALVVQNEAALPPGPLLGKRETGASALLLYDARLNKTRTLWQRTADGGQHNIAPFGAAWLPGTDCAVVVAVDVSVPTELKTRPVNTNTLLFFDFSKSLAAKILATSTIGEIMLDISPTKPFFTYQERAEGKKTKQLWMGSARGVLGTPIPLSNWTIFAGWNAAGTAVEGFELVTDPPLTPDAKPQNRTRYLEWDGQTAKPVETGKRPPQTEAVQEPVPPVLPFVLKTETILLPLRAKNEATSVLHPLYLDATEPPADTANRSALVASDADKSYLLADKSAVLYQSKGALFAIPLVSMKRDVFLAAQNDAYEQAALRNADKMGEVIFEYLQDHEEKFPSQADFTDVTKPYARGMDLYRGFTYVYPGITQATLTNVNKTIMGYVTTPAGRAVLYANRRVSWEPAK